MGLVPQPDNTNRFSREPMREEYLPPPVIDPYRFSCEPLTEEDLPPAVIDPYRFSRPMPAEERVRVRADGRTLKTVSLDDIVRTVTGGTAPPRGRNQSLGDWLDSLPDLPVQRR